MTTALIPYVSANSLEAYIQSVNRYPMLTLEEEQDLARRWRDHEDVDAARQLVLSHLRVVVSTAPHYMGYGLPQADLIQEGNIGLMKAVKRFDPALGVRLVSFAVHWIRAEIHEYVAAGKRRITMSRFTAFGGFLIGSWAFVQATVTNKLDVSWEGILSFMAICFGYRVGDSWLKNQRDADAVALRLGRRLRPPSPSSRWILRRRMGRRRREASCHDRATRKQGS